MTKLTDQLKKIRITPITAINVLGLRINLEDLLQSSDVDQRIGKLSEVRKDLEAAVEAVATLQTEALKSKTELETLQTAVKQAAQDKEAAENLLDVPEEALARVIARANAKGHLRGVLEGLAIGFATGAASSYLVSALTR